MPKQSVFTMKLESDLRSAFVAEAAASHRPASQVVRELMRDYVAKARDQRAYDAFVAAKVDAARRSIAAGEGADNDAIEAEFAARRGQAVAGE